MVKGHIAVSNVKVLTEITEANQIWLIVPAMHHFIGLYMNILGRKKNIFSKRKAIFFFVHKKDLLPYKTSMEGQIC